MRSTVWVFTFALWLVTAQAHADRAVVLPSASADASDSTARTARVALTEALSMQGLALVDFDTATRGLGKTPSPCTQVDCADRLLDAKLVDVSADVAVVRDETHQVASVSVTLRDAARHRYVASASIESGDVRGATTRALLEARALQLLGPGPWLRVDGEPDGAQVLLDGHAIGTTPYRACIKPGPHRLRVKADGYKDYEQALQIAGADDHMVEVRVALQPGAISTTSAASLDATPPPSTRVQPRGAGWLILPIATGAAGVALATFTTVRLASGLDSCVGADAAGRCTERRRAQVVPTLVYYTLSAALIGTSVLWIALGASDSETDLAAVVGLGQLSVLGRF